MARGAAYDMEGEVPEEERPFVQVPSGRAARCTRRFFGAAAATAGLLALALVLWAGAVAPGAAYKPPRRSPAMAWFQQLSGAGDCDSAKVSGDACMPGGSLLDGLESDASPQCDEGCSRVWRDLGAACPAGSEEAAAGAQLLESCGDGEDASSADDGGPGPSTDSDMPSECDFAIVDMGRVCMLHTDGAALPINCSDLCVKHLKETKKACKDDAQEQMLGPLLSVCGSCGKAVMALRSEEAEACGDGLHRLFSSGWTPCASKCHPLACDIVKHCHPGIKGGIVGLTDHQLAAMQSKAKKEMEDCPC